MNNRFMAENRAVQAPLWLNVLGMLLLGLMSLGYILFKRDLAEVNFLLPFYNGLPLFIGEMLWMACFMLAGIKLFLFRKDLLEKYWVWLVLYASWLLIKVGLGLWHYGPLALRHAALFYYPFFFAFGYLFFDRRVFNKPVIIGLMSLLCVVFFLRKYDFYWTMSLLGFSAILIMHLRARYVWAFWVVVLIAVVPFYTLFSTARMMVVGNVVSFLVFLFGLWSFGLSSKKGRIGGLLISVIGCILLARYSYDIVPPSRVFVGPGVVWGAFVEIDRGFQTPNIERDSQVSIADAQGQERKENGEASVVKLYAPEEQITSGGTAVKLYAPEEQITSGGTNESTPLVYPVQDLREWHSVNNIIFRLLIWRDMAVEWWLTKPLFGFDLGHPLRSRSLERLRWAESEWKRDGWIEPHNSFFNVLYRAGVLGIVFLGVVFFTAFWFFREVFVRRSWTLLFLAMIICNWLVAANFLLILEMPYTAIPFWTIFGMSVAYAQSSVQNNVRSSEGSGL